MIHLPPMPKLDDFPSQEYGYSCQMYQVALAAWERICALIIKDHLLHQ